MRKKCEQSKAAADKVVRGIRRVTRKYCSDKKIRVVLDGLRGESSISQNFRRFLECRSFSTE